MGEKPLGKTPLRGNPSPKMTYVSTYRITQARDEQVEFKQDQSMKGCSQKRVR